MGLSFPLTLTSLSLTWQVSFKSIRLQIVSFWTFLLSISQERLRSSKPVIH